MNVELNTPVSVQAVDAFGIDAIKKVFPDWRHRNALNEKDLGDVAKSSKVVFATDGKVLLPKAFLKAKNSNFTEINASEAFSIFDLKTLANVSERGIAPLSTTEIDRFERYSQAKLKIRSKKK